MEGEVIKEFIEWAEKGKISVMALANTAEPGSIEKVRLESKYETLSMALNKISDLNKQFKAE